MYIFWSFCSYRAGRNAGVSAGGRAGNFRTPDIGSDYPGFAGVAGHEGSEKGERQRERQGSRNVYACMNTSSAQAALPLTTAGPADARVIITPSLWFVDND